MASNIEFQTIDEGFPVAGIDNNSQGFRDNFNIIKTSLGDAQTEITDLQDNAARKDEDNDFANNSLIRVNLDTMTLSYVDGGTVLAATEVNIGNGHYHTYVIDSNLTFTLAGWPNENVATVVVELVGATAGPFTVSFIGENSGNFMSGSAGFEDSSTPVKLDVEVASTSDSRIIEFWSYDNGSTIYARYLGSYNDSVSATTEITGNTTITGDLTVEGQFNLPQGTSIESINSIDDVDAGSPSEGDLLIYNLSQSEWQTGKLSAITASLTGDVIADDGNVLINHVAKTFEGSVTGNVTGDVNGNVTGDVIATDSTVLVDASTKEIDGTFIGNFEGNVLASDSTVLVNTSTKEINGTFIGAFNGNVIATDSTVLVNATTKELEGSLTGDVTGDVTGNVTGDVTGDVTGSLTGNVVATDSSVLVNATTKEIDGTFVGEFSGDVIATDSTVLVDASTKAITGSFTGPLTGDVTGNLTGDVTGDVTGNLTGDVTGDVTGNLTGNVTGSVFLDDSTQVIDGSSGAATPMTLVMPSYSTTGRDNTYQAPATGTVIFNTTTSTFQGYNGTDWVDLTA